MSPRTILVSFALAALALTSAPSHAETIGGNPGPQYNYVCPNSDGKGPLDCYFDAITHLYTMCRHVKSIEIIEYGYEKSMEGFNGAKSEYCVIKQRINITLPYHAALREASMSKQAVEGVRSLQESWLDSLSKLTWVTGETDADYKARVAKPYDEFRDRIEGIRKIVAIVKENTTPAPARAATTAPAKAGRAAKKP